jgi:hypothetical protein
MTQVDKFQIHPKVASILNVKFWPNYVKNYPTSNRVESIGFYSIDVCGFNYNSEK